MIGFIFHTQFFHEFKSALIMPWLCAAVCVFAKFALSINMTCLLISVIIVCVVFVQEFANKQTDAIKHTRLQIINEEAKSRRVEKPTRTNVRRKKTLLLQGYTRTVLRAQLHTIWIDLTSSTNTHHKLFFILYILIIYSLI